jgi:para-nitrobenzyl esterase
MRNKTESMFRKPSEDFARQYLTSGGKVYLYRFVWMKDYDYIGACHTSDLLLLLGSKGLEGTDISMGKTESQILEEGKPMRKMWAEFARTGEVQETEIKDILTIEKLKL